MGRTSRKKIAILDEGVVLVADVDQLDFSGAGHVGSITGSNPVTVRETFSGGGGGTSNSAVGEVVSFTGTTGTLAHTPTNGIALYRGSIRLQAGVDYTLSVATITLTVAASSGEVLLADYAY